jgi:putative peptidoglycan lipid II flippase
VFRQRFLGVAVSAVGVSAASMGLAFLRQLMVAAYFGVSRELEIFLIAYAIANWVAFTFGSIFDTVAVPWLVRVRESDGAEASHGLAVKLFRASLGLGLLAALLMVVATPLIAPFAATGFDPAERAELWRLAWYFLPWIMLYLPYYAASARFKGDWRFNRVFSAEILVGAVSILALFLGHWSIVQLPFAYAVGYGAGLLWLLPGSGLLGVAPGRQGLGRVLRDVGDLYLANQTGNAPSLVDRHFQSLVPPGGIAAIGYSAQLVNGLSNLLTMREIYLVPLAGAEGRAERLERLITGLLLLSVPLAGAIACFAPEIIQLLFQRGRFGAAATALTADVLRIYAVILIPAAINTPLIRMFQILDRIRFIHLLNLASALIYIVFGAVFISWLEFGATGIAWMYVASSLPITTILVLLIQRFGIALRWRRLAGYFLLAAGATAMAAAGALAAASSSSSDWARLLTGGAVYGLVVSLIYFLARPRLRHLYS